MADTTEQHQHQHAEAPADAPKQRKIRVRKPPAACEACKQILPKAPRKKSEKEASPAQIAQRDRMKNAVVQAKELRKADPTLTQAQAVKIAMSKLKQ
jgi:hypothetical protein